AGELQPAGKDELVADLVEEGGVAERPDHLFRLRDGRYIEANDQAVARGHGQNPLQDSIGVQSHVTMRSARPKAKRLPPPPGWSPSRRMGVPLRYPFSSVPTPPWPTKAMGISRSCPASTRSTAATMRAC